jgi:hypothetical protein
VQLDKRIFGAINDISWNAAWYSAVNINKNGWTAEMKIPYFALRFPETPNQIWGINFQRNLRRYREVSYWKFNNPAIDGFVNQFGEMHGLNDIKSPLRLSVSPYISAYNDFRTANGKTSSSFTYNYGADIKYGINEAFTLDMTLIPDFGQVQSDNLVLNLSPFEIRFNDFRPFFTEGTELFNKVPALFYSRRVGGTPLLYNQAFNSGINTDSLLENPEFSQLINSFKISGRTKSKLGVGIFNATTSSTNARFQNISGEERKLETNPLTNYNMIVVDQALKNNSSITLINTNVMRSGNFYDANVSALSFRLNNKGNKYGVWGNQILSQKFDFQNKSNLQGHNLNLNFGKISGKFQSRHGVDIKSDQYDPNDLGFNLTNNLTTFNSEFIFNMFEPYKGFNNSRFFINFSQVFRTQPIRYQNFKIEQGIRTFHTSTYTFINLIVGYYPTLGYDYFEPRTAGKYLYIPKSIEGSFIVSTDYRRPFAIDVDIIARKFQDVNRQNLSIEIEPRFRFSNRFTLIFTNLLEDRSDDIGFVNRWQNQIIMGRRRVNAITNTLSARYGFTPEMNLQFRARHYFSTAQYSSYFLLNDDGFITEISQYPVNHNLAFNLFNIDLFFIWNFTPGSELRFAWKNTIFSTANNFNTDYFTNFEDLLGLPQLNSFSLKVVYFLDYSMLKKQRIS